MKKSYIPRRESIVLTAIDIIDELGIHELSTREIARRQEVSDASLYRHFNSKREILLEVLDYYSSYDNYIINTIREREGSARDSIIQFFKSYAEYYENYPAITAVGLSYCVLLYDRVVADKYIQILNTRDNFIIKLIKNGHADGSIDLRYNADTLCHVLQGTFNDITIKWRINKYNFSLKESVVSSIATVLNIS
jgi:AcrR family transcriptional regulator